jgi:hypothetical protein
MRRREEDRISLFMAKKRRGKPSPAIQEGAARRPRRNGCSQQVGELCMRRLIRTNWKDLTRKQSWTSRQAQAMKEEFIFRHMG